MDAQRGGTAADEGVPPGWALYFSQEAYSPSDRRVLLIKELGAFFKSEAGWEHLCRLEPYGGDEIAAEVDYERLKAASGLGDLSAAMEWQPEEGLACVGAAAYQVSVCVWKEVDGWLKWQGWFCACGEAVQGRQQRGAGRAPHLDV